MTKRGEEFDELYDDLVEQYRRHLRGRGRAPDLDGVDADMRAELEETFGLLGAITGMSDKVLPPIEGDRAARALGFVGGTSETVVEEGRRDSKREVLAALREFDGSDATLSESDAPVTDASAGGLLPAVAVYRRWGVVVRVCLASADASQIASEDELRRAAHVFDVRPDTTKVALVANDPGLTCVVAGPQDCRNALDPGQGAVGPATGLVALPLAMALQRLFEFVDPAWDDIPFGLAGTVGVNASEPSVEIAQTAVAAVATQVTRMNEKQAALKSLGDRELEWMTLLSRRVIGRDLAAETLGDAIDELAEAYK